MGEVAENKSHTNHEDDGKTMCRHGFHEWVAKDEKRFDDTAQKMRSVFKCIHCGKEKLEG